MRDVKNEVLRNYEELLRLREGGNPGVEKPNK